MEQLIGAEVLNARGRMDAVVKTPKYIYVFEFKLNGTAGQALQQIDEKGYLIPYQADGRELVKVGTEFSAEKRNIDRQLRQRMARTLILYIEWIQDCLFLVLFIVRNKLE